MKEKFCQCKIVTVYTVVKIRKKQLGPHSTLGCPPQSPALGALAHGSDLASPPWAGQSVFQAPSVFQTHSATEPRCRELCTASAPRHAAGQVEVLPCECQELFLGKPWPLRSGMGGKEPLT